MSDEVAAGKLFGLGAPHYGRKRVQPTREELRAFCREADDLLEHPLVWFDAAKRQAISGAVGEVVQCRNYTCWACAILTNHVYLVVRKHRDKAETMIHEIKMATAKQLRTFRDVTADHPIWSGRPYKKFMDSPGDATRTIKYVIDNPEKSGLKRQTFDFTRPYHGEWDSRRRVNESRS